jgi:ER lumen protein retaining receptor
MSSDSSVNTTLHLEIWANRGTDRYYWGLAGDLAHLASIFILLHKIQTSRSCRGEFQMILASCTSFAKQCAVTFTHRDFTGISFKTQALYVAVFVTRYLDLFLGTWISFYNTTMKLFFIGSSVYILYLIRVQFR